MKRTVFLWFALAICVLFPAAVKAESPYLYHDISFDVTTADEIEKMLIKASEYTTIVLITHNLAQAKRVCDEAMMMHEGKVIEFGPCEEVLLRPSSIETRRFVEGELIL